jgi:DNA-binding PadR family transcriptional regulator
MSSIRLFILGSLAQRGPMHGHGLLLLAEEEHIDEWTDFAPSAVYGAIKRLSAEALILEDRVEKQGNYPERQIYRISDDGQRALDELRLEGLSSIVIKPDPFNLALARLDPDALDSLPEILGRRVARLRATYETSERHLAEISHHLSIAEQWSMRHQLARWKSETEWHELLLEALPEIIADEQRLQHTKGHQ